MALSQSVLEHLSQAAMIRYIRSKIKVIIAGKGLNWQQKMKIPISIFSMLENIFREPRPVSVIGD